MRHGIIEDSAFQVDGEFIYKASKTDNWGMVWPIPLTPEILEKAGFEKADWAIDGTLSKELIPAEANLNFAAYELLWHNGVMTLSCDDNFYNADLKHIKHLHQLQNLYFAVTGEELVIKL